jgi:nicotinamidase-related amidase
MPGYHLLIIDPQNDFLDIAGAALPVPGASADMDRLAQWLRTHSDVVDSVTVTLDSHASVGVERTTFWLDAQGNPIAPFTVVTLAAVQAGQFLPRHAGRLPEVLEYLEQLERARQRQLVVWPVHCVLGTWGHLIQDRLSQALAAWELHSGNTVHKVLKGHHPLTEQYSAFRAEVPRTDDPRTALNRPLLEALERQPGTLLVAGEALSHCVAASVQDLIDYWDAERLQRTVLLTDCMSPVPGFEAMGGQFLEAARACGVRTQTLAELEVA